MLELVNTIITTLDKKRKCVTIFLDLAKAFDTVPTARLLTKLEGLGVRGIPLKLLCDYLSSRTQRVRIGDWVSEEAPVSLGVPQGSIIGPTLFLAYINDLCNLKIDSGKILTFADDTALFFSGDSWTEVFHSAQRGFDKVKKWLERNMLTLNVNKTKYIAFALRASQLPPISMQITAHSCHQAVSPCSCVVLERTCHIRHLGVIVDQTLSFKPHIDALVPKLRKLIYIFKTLKNIADHQVKRMVYYALCQPLLEYCISTWGGTAKTTLLDVERAQRAILKVSAGLPFLHPTVDLYRKWNVLTVRQTFILQIILKKHSTLDYCPDLLKDKRRNKTVASKSSFKTASSQRFYCFLGNFLYNKLNKLLDFYHLPRSCCKIKVKEYLKELDYQSTERLITVPT